MSAYATNNIDKVVATGTALVESETVVLRLVDQATENQVNYVTFGDNIKLQALLTKRNTEVAATGVTIHDCAAVNNLVAPTKTVYMIGADGCTSPGLGLYPDNMGFTLAAMDFNTVKTESPIFKAFIVIDGSSTIAFRCKAAFCYQDDDRCNTSCTQSKRKKRQSEVMDDTPPTIDEVALLTVSRSHLSALKNEKQDTEYLKVWQTGVKAELKKKVTACVSNVNVARMAILGTILALTVIVGVLVVIVRPRNVAASAKSVVS